MIIVTAPEITAFLPGRAVQPIGTQTVIAEFPTADSVTISRHVKTPEIRTYMTLAPLKDLS
ncbi:MAG: hypothetical protein ACR2L8_11695, partial [Solirubrobacteraceae bacterium]